MENQGCWHIQVHKTQIFHVLVISALVKALKTLFVLYLTLFSLFLVVLRA